MAEVAGRTGQLLHEQGPGSIGFYSSGQLFLEEYRTLAVIARACPPPAHGVGQLERRGELLGVSCLSRRLGRQGASSGEGL